MDLLQVNIKLCKLHVAQRISESISENLRRDYAWPSSEFIQICRTVMSLRHVPTDVQREIIQLGVNEGYENYFEYRRTGLYTHHNASGQHPELLIGDVLDRLVGLLAKQQSRSA